MVDYGSVSASTATDIDGKEQKDRHTAEAEISDCSVCASRQLLPSDEYNCEWKHVHLADSRRDRKLTGADPLLLSRLP